MSSRLTKYELLEIEKSQKTRAQAAGDIVICILPVVLAFLSLAEYCFMENVRENKNPEVYIIAFCVFLAAYIIRGLCSIKNKMLFMKMRQQAPIISAIIVVLTVYDCLTLKSGALILPFFPWVNQVLCAFLRDWAYLLECTLATLKLLSIGYCGGAVLGVITGIACGYSSRVHYWIFPVLKLLGPIPPVTWIPIVMVLSPSLFAGSAFIVGLGVWYSVSLATITGISNVDKSYYAVARTLGARSFQMVIYIAIPHALPSIFQGLTQGMSTACVALMVAEMIGVESGLGWYVIWQKSWALYANMYAAIVLICAIFTAITSLLALIKKKVLRWQEGVV